MYLIVDKVLESGASKLTDIGMIAYFNNAVGEQQAIKARCDSDSLEWI